MDNNSLRATAGSWWKESHNGLCLVCGTNHHACQDHPLTTVAITMCAPSMGNGCPHLALEQQNRAYWHSRANKAEAALSQAQQALRWISVSEKPMPEDENVLARIEYKVNGYLTNELIVCYCDPEDGDLYAMNKDDIGWSAGVVTHWMPLPEAALPSDAPPSSELNLPCLACGKPKNDSTMHHDAPGTNWGAALHWFEAPPSDAPEATK